MNIQAAIDALPSLGGRVKIPPMVHEIARPPVINRSGIVLEGEGSASVLRLKDGANDDVIQVVGKDTVEWGIKNLKIDGNSANNTRGSGIHISTDGEEVDSFSFIDKVFMDNIPAHGVNIDDVDVREIHLLDVVIYHAGYDAFHMRGNDHKLSNCTAAASFHIGFYSYDGSSQYTNCKAFWCGRNYTGASNFPGFRVAGSGIQLTGCHAQDNHTDGFHILGKRITMTGCHGDSNHNRIAFPKNGTFAGIRISGEGNLILGNTCSNRNTQRAQDYGIIVENKNNVIGPNQLKGNIKGEILYLDGQPAPEPEPEEPTSEFDITLIIPVGMKAEVKER